MDLRSFVRDIPDFPKPGILFRDITPLLGNGEAFCHCVEKLASVGERHGVKKVVAIESRGFLFGSAVAQRLRVGVVPVRKKGKLPFATLSTSYALEYGQDTLEMHVDAISPGDAILLVDDVLATGGTAEAVVRLVEMAGGRPTAAAFAIELGFLKGRSKLANFEVSAVLTYY